MTQVVDTEILGEGGVLSFHFLKHGISNVAIGGMPGRSSAQLGDVNRLGKIHLEEGALTEAQRNGILRVLDCFGRGAAGQGLYRGRGPLHRGFAVVECTGGLEFRGNLVSMLHSERLLDLNTAAMPM